MNKTHTPQSVLPLLALLFMAGSAQSVRAQALTTPGLASPPAPALTPAQGLLADTFVLNGGTFVVASEMRARLNGETNTSNQEIDFDHTFGKPANSNRVRVDGLWRITPAHHVRVLWFDNSSSNSRTIAEDFTWGDNTYQAGATVVSETKFKVAELAYEWAFLHTPNYEVAATFGVHYMELSMKLSGNATVAGGGGSMTASYTTENNKLPMPLPVIGIRAGWAVTPHLYLEASGQVFKAKYDVYDGLWNDVRANATWMFNRNFGLGAGYNVFFTRLTVEKPDYNGTLRMGYSGLQVFATIGF